MSQVNFFIDTNIFVYALIAFQDRSKHELAVKLLSQIEGSISSQVVNEICSNVIRLTNASEQQIEKIIKDLFSKYLVIIPSESTLLKASNLRGKYKFSFWDNVLVASALEAGATILYSEDMQHKAIIDDSLTIINPFLG
jgi:predicted nucleic acid-binding protein